jgi:hypothetical protein
LAEPLRNDRQNPGGDDANRKFTDDTGIHRRVG